MSGNSLLEVKNVTKIFRSGLLGAGAKSVKALENVSFTLPGDKPNITALVGESGSGKTTMLRLILGLITPSSGEILYKGNNIYSLLKKDWKRYRREVQIIFQDPYSIYNPFYRVERVLEMVVKKFNLASNEKDAKALIEDTLRSIGLRPQDVLGRYPHQISGGERQRLMLARILLMKPKLILADEPVSMIDASLRAIFLDALLDFKKKYGMSSLYVTHDLNIAHYISDDIIVLCQGRIVEKGPTANVIGEPIHPYTKTLIASIPIPDPSRRWKEKIDVKIESLEKRGREEGCVFYDRCPKAMEICAEKKPPLIEVGNKREVACFLYGKEA